LLLIDGVVKSAAAREGLRQAPCEAARFQLLARRSEDGLRSSKLSDQFAGLPRTETGNQAQCEPVQLFFFGEGRGRHSIEIGAGRPGKFSVYG
jgi:hypothetical protein